MHPAHPPSLLSARRLSHPRRLGRVAALGLAFAAAAVSLRADEALAKDARAAMEKATAYLRSISTEGGYLWRYSPDLSERAGENKATPTQIWVQPPGTPAVGMAFVRAYEVTRDARYLEAARAAAEALVVGQLESGGWDYLIDFDPKLSKAWYRRSDVGKIGPAEAAKRKNVSTYDDNTTQSALRFLLALADVTKDSTDPRDVRIRDARDYGLAKLVAAQRPNGGWPQRFSGAVPTAAEFPVQPARYPKDYPREHPNPHNYAPYYTLNDDTHRDCVITMLEAAKRLGKPEYRAAALKGGDFLILAQLPEPQPAWAQQYNQQLEPAWARAFEPPCVCSNESAGAMRLLVDLYLETGEAKYLEPLPRAIAWFKRSEIAPGIWARMYELHTNKPIYGDRDGKIKYRVEDLSPERQTGYSWKSSYGVPEAIAYYERVKSGDRAALLQKRNAAPSRKGSRAPNETRVRAVIAELDGQGRWLSAPNRKGGAQIRTDTFIANLRLLADYLESTK